MGQTDKKPVIIEFNGLPGAGKTTTAFEVKKRLRNMEIREIPPKRITGYRRNYKEFILSKEIRDTYVIFLKALFLIRPVTMERIRFMNMAFNYWLGIRNLHISEKQRNGICILDQGVIQLFVSMAYLGKIRNEEKYYRYIGQVMNSLDNIICVNCNVNTGTSVMRIHSRKPNGSRLYQVCDDSEMREILKIQGHQFERIREMAIKRAITINMNDSVEYNAEKVVEYCMRYL